MSEEISFIDDKNIQPINSDKHNLYYDRSIGLGDKLDAIDSHLLNAVRKLDYGYIIEVEYSPDDTDETAEQKEHEARERAIQFFHDTRKKLVEYYKDPDSTPIVSITARANELYMLAYAYNNGFDNDIFDEQDYNLTDKYPELFDQYNDNENTPDIVVDVLNAMHDTYNEEENQSPVINIVKKHGLLPIIEKDLGIDISVLSDQEVDSLGTFLLGGTASQYNRLRSILSHIDDEQRVVLAKAFLALEFGDEFGDIILDTCDNCTPDQAQAVLGSISRFRQLEPDVEALFANVDKEFAEQTGQALRKRITEVLAVVASIATTGEASTTLYNGEQVQLNDIDDVIAQLNVLNDAIEHGVLMLGQKTPTKHSVTDNIHSFWYGQGDTLVQIREVGDADFDPGYGFDGEARINVLYSPTAKISDKVADESRQRALSIRLDREGIIRDIESNIIDNDPELTKGAVSLDIGSIFGDPSDPNVAIGRVLAIGNALIAQGRGEKPNFTHVRETFDDKYGVDAVFAKIARNLRRRLSVVSGHISTAARVDLVEK